MAKRDKNFDILDEEGLTDKERHFVDRLLIHGVKGRAAKEAGYQAGNEHRFLRRANDLLKKKPVRELYKKKLAERQLRLERNKITKERLLMELSRLATSDLRDYFNDDGSLRAVHELDDIAAACLAGVESQDLYEGHGEDRERIGELKKVKLHDKNKAIDMLMKHLRMYEPDVEQKKDRLAEIVRAIQMSPTEEEKGSK